MFVVVTPCSIAFLVPLLPELRVARLWRERLDVRIRQHVRVRQRQVRKHVCILQHDSGERPQTIIQKDSKHIYIYISIYIISIYIYIYIYIYYIILLGTEL